MAPSWMTCKACGWSSDTRKLKDGQQMACTGCTKMLPMRSHYTEPRSASVPARPNGQWNKSWQARSASQPERTQLVVSPAPGSARARWKNRSKQPPPQPAEMETGLDKPAISAEISRLTSLVATLDPGIDGEVIATLQSKIADHKKTLREAKPVSAQITSLDAAIARKEMKVSSLQQDIRDTQTDLADAELDLSQMQEDLAKLKAQEAAERGIQPVLVPVQDPQQAEAFRLMALQLETITAMVTSIASIPNLPPSVSQAMGAYAPTMQASQDSASLAQRTNPLTPATAQPEEDAVDFELAAAPSTPGAHLQESSPSLPASASAPMAPFGRAKLARPQPYPVLVKPEESVVADQTGLSVGGEPAGR